MSQATLFLVATPLGNLQDMSPRAVTCLKEVGAVYAEDTRRSRILLDHFGIHKPLKSLFVHNEHERIREVVELLTSGTSVALVSDAGTPGVSDPGAGLVAAVAHAGIPVSPIPGPSALTAALSVSGFAAASTDAWFVGFLPTKGVERRQLLDRIGRQRGVVVLFEAPHRVRETLEQLALLDPSRAACVCRELTKVFQEVRHAPISELANWASTDVRGELTVVLGPNLTPPETATDETVDAALARCLEAGLSARDASTAVAAVLGVSRRAVYGRCQKVKQM
jgi:16S rRNA (cytidine1402-2'-O)-methyltransferase